MTPPVELLYTVPIGTVLCWYPLEAGQMPDGFVPCDGNPVSDPDSPFNGRTVPNLINRFVLGSGGSISVNQADGDTGFNLDGYQTPDTATSPTTADQSDVTLNNIVVEGAPRPTSDTWRYVLTTDNSNYMDGNHHHMVSVAIPAPGWTALQYIIRIK